MSTSVLHFFETHENRMALLDASLWLWLLFLMVLLIGWALKFYAYWNNQDAAHKNVARDSQSHYTQDRYSKFD